MLRDIFTTTARMGELVHTYKLIWKKKKFAMNNDDLITEKCWWHFFFAKLMFLVTNFFFFFFYNLKDKHLDYEEKKKLSLKTNGQLPSPLPLSSLNVFVVFDDGCDDHIYMIDTNRQHLTSNLSTKMLTSFLLQYHYLVASTTFTFNWISLSLSLSLVLVD